MPLTKSSVVSNIHIYLPTIQIVSKYASFKNVQNRSIHHTITNTFEHFKQILKNDKKLERCVYCRYHKWKMIN